ncbi:hypothetical protein IMCC1989_1975 [gamma proteobacterium IMCC1989]|nr:hypothetical protein IMCC1989_1975 [gamma proteobacterium IMCC1989]
MGGTISIPIDISMLAITISTNKKGRNIIKPIWNAVFNSLKMNAGTRCIKLTSLSTLGVSAFARSTISNKSSSLVCLSIKPLKLLLPISTADCMLIFSCIYGCIAFSSIAVNVGIILNNVKNKARLISTVFGGVCCIPNAMRNIERTTIIRINDVITTIAAGAKLNAVMPINIFTAFAMSALSSEKSTASPGSSTSAA